MSRSDPIFTAANLLSLARLPLGLVFWLVLRAPWGGALAATGVLVLAGITDVLDGAVARRALARRTGKAGGMPAGTGSWLDPICDKLFVASVLAAIWVERRPGLSLLALIMTRELAQLPLAVIYAVVPSLRRWLRYDFRASLLGKAATLMQFLAILALLFRHPAVVLFATVAFVVGLLALADYIVRAVRIGRERLTDPPAHG
jgi:cardiolipin synthase (CMP-forming)